MRHPVYLLVIEPKTGYVSRFKDRKCENIVHTDAPHLLGSMVDTLNLFRLWGPIAPPPEVA